MSDRLPATQAAAALDAIVWPDDPRVTQRDVLHAANVILWRHAAPSVQAAFARLQDRCNQRVQSLAPGTDLSSVIAP